MPELGTTIDDLMRRCGLAGVRRATVLTVLAAALVGVAWCAWRWWPSGETATFAGGTEGVSVEPSAAPPSSAEATALVVHVVGAVRRPGVYRLAPGSRVEDAVDAAGGMLGDAAPEGVNLARLVQDGEQLCVPKQGEVGSAPAAASGGAGSGGRIDLNTADEAALDTLPGIGPSTAKRIVDDRAANGPFKSVEELDRVPGIGPSKVEQLKDLVTVG